MTTLVFIHGGAHGSWCWQPLTGLLDVPMLALDLPGRGRRPARLERQSYSSFTASAEADIRRCDLNNVVLVAHSMGSMTAIGLLNTIPERIRQVIFIACPIPPEGMSVGEYMRTEVEATADRTDAQTAIRSGEGNQGIADMLFHDCDPKDRAWAMERLTAESMAVYNEPVSLVGLSAHVPRTYLRTARDRGLPPRLQDDSITRLGSPRVHSLDTGHTPMLADPHELARVIERAIDEVP